MNYKLTNEDIIRMRIQNKPESIDILADEIIRLRGYIEGMAAKPIQTSYPSYPWYPTFWYSNQNNKVAKDPLDPMFTINYGSTISNNPLYQGKADPPNPMAGQI